jgi:hypothetical protein
MNCPNCGQEIVRPGKFCVECGAALPTEQPAQPQPVPQPQPTSRAAFVRADYDPARDGHLPYQNQTTPPPAQPVPRQPNAGMIVFSIVNMVCCGCGISFILGIIALIFAIGATGAGKTPEAAQHDLKIAKIINFVGLGFVILSIVAIIILIIIAVMGGNMYNWEDYIPEGTGFYR